MDDLSTGGQPNTSVHMHPLERYLQEMRTRRGTGAATDETTYYSQLENLLNTVGRGMKPRVVASAQMKNQGAGSPDFGLFTTDQIREEEPVSGALPSRGVIEVKALEENVISISEKKQVSKYWGKYRQVLITNYREFLLIGQVEGHPYRLETFSLAESADEFWKLASEPAEAAEKHGERLLGYLQRVMLHAATLADPKDVAWMLASYARDARVRLKEANMEDLKPLQQALEGALGLEFRGTDGDRFFRSTIVQTLFYGLFSAWVLWHRENPVRTDNFTWQGASSYLNVPVLGRIFHELIFPAQLQRLNLRELVNWATAALNRVDRASFFSKFDQGRAVQYFYEPFLEAFDPDLRKRLGVWYTPPEVVDYMVERVDTVLREELGLADGLADEGVIVLDPACGTGAYLVAALRRIAVTLREREGDALLGSELKRAAMERVFGFEILTASFVVAHLQVGLLLRELGVPFGASSAGKEERAGVFLTNALTGWQKNEGKPKLPFPELTEEREAAEEIKLKRKVLVVLGNPPYDRYTDVALGEESELVTPYRKIEAENAPVPEGPGLNDLFVRFFRIAERQIVEDTRRGVVCLITNNSWLDRRSYPGMRERYLRVFDRIWIDNLHGDARDTGKVTPDGKPDPSIFSTKMNPEGIRKGTAITLLVKKQAKGGTSVVLYRDLWGEEKLVELEQSKTLSKGEHYEPIKPRPELGYPFLKRVADEAYLSWPRLPDLFPFSTPGVFTARDEIVVDVDKGALENRMRRYFDAALSHEQVTRELPGAMEGNKQFDGVKTRSQLLLRGYDKGKVYPYLYRPFDLRWLYWEPKTKLLDRNRPEFVQHFGATNLWMGAVKQNRKSFDPPPVTSHLASLHVIERGANFFPMFITQESLQLTLFAGESPGLVYVENLTEEARRYVEVMDAGEGDLFYYAIAVQYAHYYGEEHEGALRQDWPRIPLPSSRRLLLESAELGRMVAGLIEEDVEGGSRPSPSGMVNYLEGVTSGKLHPWFQVIGIATRSSGGSWKNTDYEVTARWGYLDKRGATMPSTGKVVERAYTEEEEEAFRDGGQDRTTLLGTTTFDVYLNNEGYWKNIPKKVWEFSVGGYQVLKKWLSYREKEVLGRSLNPREIRHFMNTARRIAALLLLQERLNENYEDIKSEALTGFGVLVKREGQQIKDI